MREVLALAEQDPARDRRLLRHPHLGRHARSVGHRQGLGDPQRGGAASPAPAPATTSSMPAATSRPPAVNGEGKTWRVGIRNPFDQAADHQGGRAARPGRGDLRHLRARPAHLRSARPRHGHRRDRRAHRDRPRRARGRSLRHRRLRHGRATASPSSSRRRGSKAISSTATAAPRSPAASKAIAHHDQDHRPFPRPHHHVPAGALAPDRAARRGARAQLLRPGAATPRWRSSFRPR